MLSSGDRTIIQKQIRIQPEVFRDTIHHTAHITKHAFRVTQSSTASDFAFKQDRADLVVVSGNITMSLIMKVHGTIHRGPIRHADAEQSHCFSYASRDAIPLLNPMQKGVALQTAPQKQDLSTHVVKFSVASLP